MDNKEKALEDLVQKAIQSNEVEKQSLDFTANIMASVEAVYISEITKYKSPISKTAWAAIFVIVGGLCTYLLFNTNGEESSWLSSLDFSFITESSLATGLSSLAIPSSVLYGIVALAVMTILQVPIYKRYYEKRFGV